MLALAQSNWVKDQIEKQHPHVGVELVRIKTKGDKSIDSPLSKIGGKGLFVKEIEDSLLRNDVDLAVHSIKDVPAELPDGLCLPVFPEREEPFDAFLSVDFKAFEDLPEGATVGTGSLRRSAQLLHLRPDLEIIPIRGNVDTRIKKVESGELQSVILASAGLRRLGFSPKITQVLGTDQILPAIGQGALGLEVREGDNSVLDILGFLNHQPTEIAVRAERTFLRELEGGCQVPIAGYCSIEDGKLRLKGMVAELDGSRLIMDEETGSSDDPEALGIEVAGRLLRAGASVILDKVYGRK
jgi:hydroxymethylbilane synthase